MFANATAGESSSLDILEQLKDALLSNVSGVRLNELIRSTVTSHPSILSRRIHGEPLYISLARHCIANHETGSLKNLTSVFFRVRELGRVAADLKQCLLNSIVNTTAIAGLFCFPLTEPEVTKVCRAAFTRSIAPDLDTAGGLAYDQWLEYTDTFLNSSEGANANAELRVQLEARRKSHNVCVGPSKILPTSGEAEELLKLGNSTSLPSLSTERWHQILRSPCHRTRCIAADLVGTYISNGRHQDTTLRMLVASRRAIPSEVFLRAVSVSCIALARSINGPPARFPEDAFSQPPDVVLPLTQQRAPDSGVVTVERQNEEGVWSYLNSFQGQCLLFLSLFDAFRESEPTSLFAAHHFLAISKALGRTPWQLCQPFWPLIAPKVVRHYNVKFVDWFCSAVLQVSRQDFMLRTAGIIIPHLCQSGKKQMKVCEEIASFRGCSPRRLYIDNTAAIIAMFMMSSSEDVEIAWSTAEEEFMSIDRSFKSVNFSQILASWRVDAIYEVLMLTTERNAPLGIGIVNKIMECAYSQHSGEHKELLQQTVFKLVVKFSETMRNLMGRQSQSTKLAALAGLKIFIERFMNPSLVASVLRQLTAFLQAALDDRVLSLTALATWHVVVQKLEITKLEAIIDLTYAILNENVDSWDRDVVSCAKSMIQTINTRLNKNANQTKIHPQSIFEKSATYTMPPSDLYGEGHAPYDILQSLVERDVENTYLAQQTARDFCAFSLDYQDEILGWAQSEGPGHDLLGQAVRILLNLCAKNNEALQKLSSRALGLIGALDPHRISINSKESTLVVVNNFQNTGEVISFCRNLVQDWFLPAFEAAIDPAQQRYFAYGIQELLKFMGIEEENKLRTLFRDPDLVSTLFPLVKTKYTTDMKHWTPPAYPIYEAGRSYSDWLVLLSSDMMGRTLDPEYATRIFTWCRKVLYGSEAGSEMWAYIFPYAALAAVVDRNENNANREIFLSEVLLVLNTEGEHMQPFHERIFACFDYFNQWMRLRRQAKLPLLDMDTLLASIPARVMAQRALDSGAYPRAIRYFEQQVRVEKETETAVLRNLRHIHAAMQDVDALEGVSARMSTLSIEQQVLEYRATSQWDAALACYNALPESEANFAATLECLHRSGREREVLTELSVKGVSTDLAAIGAECAWFVRDWDALERWSALIGDSQPNNSQIPPQSMRSLSQALLFLNRKDWNGFKCSLEAGRKHVGKKLGDIMATHNVTSLRQVRELMVYLHGLADVESLGTLVMPGYVGKDVLAQKSTLDLIKSKLDTRLGVLSPLSEGPEFEARRYLLSLRAATLSCIQTSLQSASLLIGDAHLEISAAARHHGQASIALKEIATAKSLDNTKADIEYAYLLWSQGESRSAIKMLQSQIPPKFFDKPKLNPEYASHALEWTTWRDLAAQVDTKVIVDDYSAIIKAMPQSAEAQYRLAKHYVKIYDESGLQTRSDGSLSRLIVHHFCKALELGTPRANEALPKMLTTWFELGIVPDDLLPQQISSRKHCLSQVNKEIQQWGKSIDKKLVYTAVPQLLSRQSHPNKTVKSLVEQLIILVLQCYPHHTLWPVLEKGEAVTGLVQQAAMRVLKTEQKSFDRLVSASAEFVEKLKRLCALKPKPKEMKLKELGEDFGSCLKTPSLAVPVQMTMKGLENILIYQIEERVVIQQSLQRPKRIVIWGTDGNQYQLLLKGHDDVRKDARLIEFTSAVNSLLRSDPSAAARHLDILTYRVTPLGANAGVIEWVKGALPARNIINSLSREPNLCLSSPEVKKMTNVSARMKDRLSAFRALEKTVRPVLWEWFVGTFPDPEAWLDARTRYARSLAVMSMVGYILGLGDRHLENILLVQSSGSVLHVDFDCLFDKGKHLAVPELVPFRLTQQFRDALGVMNTYEGPFRKVCELTLGIVRANEDLLMVVLEAFIHDPVVQDRINLMQPRETMERLSAKIRGIREPNSVPLSVGGLVDELIQQAISPENLCQLFKGWMPWV